MTASRVQKVMLFLVYRKLSLRDRTVTINVSKSVHGYAIMEGGSVIEAMAMRDLLLNNFFLFLVLLKSY